MFSLDEAALDILSETDPILAREKKDQVLEKLRFRKKVNKIAIPFFSLLYIIFTMVFVFLILLYVEENIITERLFEILSFFAIMIVGFYRMYVLIAGFFKIEKQIKKLETSKTRE